MEMSKFVTFKTNNSSKCRRNIFDDEEEEEIRHNHRI